MVLRTWEGMMMRKSMGEERKSRMVQKKKLDFGMECIYVCIYYSYEYIPQGESNLNGIVI